MIDRACISLNARCNLKCVYCHFANKKNNALSRENEFTAKEAMIFCTNLYNYIKKYGIKLFKLGIVGSGEPLLSFGVLKTIVDFFASSDLKNNIKIYTISNGTLLTKNIINYFYENRDAIDLNISIDGDKTTNEKLRGFFPDFSMYKEKFGKMPIINAVVTKETIENRKQIVSFFVDNGFDKVNFSKVFATSDSSIMVKDKEYEQFLKYAKMRGIVSRQHSIETKYDCAKYGKLCGVGRNNIFFTKTGVYPCGRFMNIKKYNIGNWDTPIEEIEKKLHEIKPCPDGFCYFEYNKVEEIK